MDIHESPLYGESFSADEFADEIEGFGTLDERDMVLERRPDAFIDLVEADASGPWSAWPRDGG